MTQTFDQDHRKSSKKPYHHGDLRHALVDASRKLVEEMGPAHFSVARAARAAGVSSAAPYRHFKDRDEMLDAVARDGLERLAQAFAEATAPFPLGSVDALTALGLAYIAFAQAQPSVFRLMFATFQDQSDETCVAGEGCKAHLLCQVAAHLGHDGVTEDTHRIAFPIWTMVHGISFLLIDGKAGTAERGLPIETVLRDATEKLLAAGGKGT